MEKIDKDQGTIWLYQRPDAGQVFHARIKIDGRKSYIIKSTKKKNISQAIIVAEKLYFDNIGTKDKSSAPLFPVVARKMFSEKKDIQKYVILRLENHPFTFWRDSPIDQITKQELSAFLLWREKTTNPTPQTLKNEMVQIKKVFVYAYSEKLIDKVPEFPKTDKISVSRRPAFSADEIFEITTHLRTFQEQEPNNRGRLYLRYYVLLLSQTGMRTGEAQNLRWNCLSYIETTSKTLTIHNTTPRKKAHFTITIPEGKTDSRVVVASGNIKGYLKHLKEYREKELGHSVPSDEYIFCRMNGKKSHSFAPLFSQFLEEYGFLLNVSGEKRTLYSIRHFFATNAINQDINLHFLAQNLGTSILMLQKHYLQSNIYQYADVFSNLNIPDGSDSLDHFVTDD